MSGDDPDGDRLIAEIERFCWGILLILLFISLFFRSFGVTLGVLIGGLISVFNFRWLKAFVRRVVYGGNAYRVKASFKLKYIFRYLAVGVIIYAVMKAGLVNKPAIFLGLSVVVMGIIAVGIKNSFIDAKRRRH
jgi:hypothetical protein